MHDLTQTNVDTLINDAVDNDELCICPDVGTSVHCSFCPCSDVHDISECAQGYRYGYRPYGCQACEPLDIFQFEENEREFDKLHPVLILDSMPSKWGPGITMTTRWAHWLLDESMPHNLFTKYGSVKKLPTNKTAIKFRRY